MPSLRIFVLLILAQCLLLPATEVRGHGGQTMEEDECKFRIGPHLIHFTGYQPRQRMGEEFCKQIPETGRTIIVFDAFSDELRPRQIAVRIVEDTGKPADYGHSTPAIAAVGPELFTDGTISLEHEFPESGNFVGIVTVASNGNPSGDYTGHFRFSVGIEPSFYGQIIRLAILAALIGAGLYFLPTMLARRRGKRLPRRS